MCDVLEINYPNGHMVIYLKGVFPKNKKQFHKFMKFIRSLPDYEEYLNVLKVYFQKIADENEEEFKLCGKVYFRYKQLYAETKNQVDNGKYSNSVYIEEKQLREMKDDIKIYRNIYQSYEKQGKSTKRKMENFKYFLKVVNEGVL